MSRHSRHKNRASSRASTKPAKMRKKLESIKNSLVGIMIVGIVVFLYHSLDASNDVLSLWKYFFPYRNNMTFKWTDLNSAEWIMGDSDRYTPDSDSTTENTFNEAAALLFTYNNMGDDERVITEMTVSASNIVEDYSPKLSSNFAMTEDRVGYAHISNPGWGDTGAGQITYDGYDLSETGSNAKIDMSLDLKNTGPWTFDALAPGGYCDIPIISDDDLLIRSDNVADGTTVQLHFRVDIAENDLHSDFVVFVSYYNNEWSISSHGVGGPWNRAIGFLIDTSEENYSQTIPVSEAFTSHKMSLFPVYIFPKMSCSMSVDVTFKTQDGKTIQAVPLENAHFTVPYYTDAYPPFLDGDEIDWVTFNESYDRDYSSVGFPYMGYTN